MLKDKERAKFNLAVNVFCRLQDLDLTYSQLAEQLNVYPSRIQKVLEQTSSPDWQFVLNLAEALGLSAEQLGAPPSRKAVDRYLKKYPEKFLEPGQVG